MSISKTISMKRKSISTNYGELAYIQTGEGPAAIFIPGLFVNADLWQRQLEALADVRRCIAVDLLGHGQSSYPEGVPLTHDLQAEAILELIDALDLDQVDLIGNDSGGAIAQLILARAPERVRTLTFTNCEVHDNWPPEGAAAMHEAAENGHLAGALTMLSGDAQAAKAGLATGLENPDQISEETALSFFAPFASQAKAAAVQEYMAGADNTVTVAIKANLERCHVPTLIVWGTGDQLFGVKWAEWLASTIPGTVRCVNVEGAKMFFPIERPTELNHELRELWTGPSPLVA
jgi:pimeloyl-ACP methyl ester carboxylesterase